MDLNELMQNLVLLFATSLARVSKAAQPNNFFLVTQTIAFKKKSVPLVYVAFPSSTWPISLPSSAFLGGSWQIAHVAGSDFTPQWKLMDLAGSLLDPCGTI